VIRSTVALILSLAGGALVFAPAKPVGAQEAAASGGEDIRADLHAYYAGERTEAVLFVGLGALSVAGGSALVARGGSFSRGFGWSAISLGALEVVGAAGYAFVVQGEIADWSARLARDPTSYKHDEAEHIHGTTSRFASYRLGEAAVLLGGLGVAAYGFASKRDAWQGAGLGVAAQAAVLLTFDTFGQSRARWYEERLHRFEPQMALEVGGAGRPWGVGLGGRF
jgi:hypothetical protein